MYLSMLFVYSTVLAIVTLLYMTSRTCSFYITESSHSFAGRGHPEDVTEVLTCALDLLSQSLLTYSPLLGMCILLAFPTLEAAPRTQP